MRGWWPSTTSSFWRSRRAWIAPSTKHGRTIHHLGKGMFLVACRTIKLPSKMKLLSIVKNEMGGARSVRLPNFSNKLGQTARLRDRTPTFPVRVTEDGLTAGSRQPRRRFVLWNWIQLLKRTGECVREAPHGSRLELLMCGLKVQLVHAPRQCFGNPSSSR